MKIIKFDGRSAHREIVLALGNFDGVHVGHKKLLTEAVIYSRKKKLPCFAMTFDPHPQEVVSPGRGLSLLTTLPERIELMRQLKVDGVIIKRFTKAVSRLSPEAFIRGFLVKPHNVKKVFVGYDFAFGYKRKGTLALLKKLGIKYGFELHAVKPVMTHGHVVKSSTIRDMLTRGDFFKAIKLLGHPYTIIGKVVKGRGRGRQLGFPTANLDIAPDKLVPKHGVYFCRWNKRKCIVNIGSRPTFAEERFAVEVHIPGFRGNLRGRMMRVELLKRLRDEIHFADVEDLKSQISKDIRTLRAAPL